MIPPLVDGRLPPGRWPSTITDLYVHFVNNAPNRERRQLIFTAFTLYTKLIAVVSNDVRLWVDGGFVTHKPEPPKDIDVVAILPANANVAAIPDRTMLQMHTLHQGFAPWLPVDRLQPIGGLVDSFIVADDDESRSYWDNEWTKVNGKGLDIRKGYLEVTL